MGYFVLKIEISKLFNIYLKTHHMKLWSMGQISPSEKSDILNQHKEIYNGYQTMQPKVSNTQPLYVQDFANDKGGIVVNNKGQVKQYTNFGINEQFESKEVCDECGAMEMSEGGGMCNECGGMMSEGECMECGWKGGGTMMEYDELDEDIYDIEDINSMEGFDYTEPKASNKINAYGDFKEGQTYPHDSEVPLGSSPEEMKEKVYPHDSQVPIGSEQEMDEFEYHEYDMMESAWQDELDEVDVSGSQGIYGSMQKPYDFVSDGPGKGATYQEFSFESELEEWDSDDSTDDGWDGLDEDLYESFITQKERINEMMVRMKILK